MYYQRYNEKTKTRYTTNGTLPAQRLHKACTTHKHKHFHEIIQVSLFMHNGTWFHISTNFRANRSAARIRRERVAAQTSSGAAIPGWRDTKSPLSTHRTQQREGKIEDHRSTVVAFAIARSADLFIYNLFY